MFRRTVKERVQAIAPSCATIRPYIVWMRAVCFGCWMPIRLRTAIPTPSPIKDGATTLRSVKVIVDAFHGTVDFISSMKIL